MRIEAGPDQRQERHRGAAIRLDLDDTAVGLTRAEAEELLEKVQVALNALWLLDWDRRGGRTG